MNRLSDYDYELPESLIAAEPLPVRHEARLLVVNRTTGRFEHAVVGDLPDLLRSGDRLVLNNTQVLPARLFGVRTQTGGRWEGLFLELTDENRWRILCQTRGKLQPGETIDVGMPDPRTQPDRCGTSMAGEKGFRLELVARCGGGIWEARPDRPQSHIELLRRCGTMPLPPYIDRPARPSDWDRYQTTYASRPGAVAAPTAGLHFSREVLERCAARGVARTHVTLHVGIGTFRPIAVESLAEHQMHSEWCELSTDAAAELQATRRTGGRIVAVGTTSVRTLESAAAAGRIEPFCGGTDLFIRPPYTFRAVDVLFTNFHLPKSSLLVLVSAFAGRELVLRAYEEAIQKRYRFFSYGDAMLIL